MYIHIYIYIYRYVCMYGHCHGHCYGHFTEDTVKGLPDLFRKIIGAKTYESATEVIEPLIADVTDIDSPLVEEKKALSAAAFA